MGGKRTLSYQVYFPHGTSTYIFLDSLFSFEHIEGLLRHYIYTLAYIYVQTSAVDANINHEVHLPRMKALTIMSVSDINTLVSGDWMRINNLSTVNAMLELFLHFSMHHKKRIMRQVYRHLAFDIRP